jgi:hypothetical protein
VRVRDGGLYFEFERPPIAVIDSDKCAHILVQHVEWKHGYVVIHCEWLEIVAFMEWENLKEIAIIFGQAQVIVQKSGSHKRRV